MRVPPQVSPNEQVIGQFVAVIKTDNGSVESTKGIVVLYYVFIT